MDDLPPPPQAFAWLVLDLLDILSLDVVLIWYRIVSHDIKAANFLVLIISRRSRSRRQGNCQGRQKGFR